MKTTQAKLGGSLLKSLIGLRERKGQILIEDVGAILEGMATDLPGSGEAADEFLRSEIQKMAKYIVQAKQEILHMVPNEEEGAPKNINIASLELTEVVKTTEEATNTIMDAADAINTIASKVGGTSVGNELMEQTAKIYDACSFQDITGQRINKVIATLEHVEARVTNLVKLFGGELPDGYVPPVIKEKAERPDEHLMNGPQLTGEMPSQDDIDALFADVKN